MKAFAARLQYIPPQGGMSYDTGRLHEAVYNALEMFWTVAFLPYGITAIGPCIITGRFILVVFHYSELPPAHIAAYHIDVFATGFLQKELEKIIV